MYFSIYTINPAFAFSPVAKNTLIINAKTLQFDLCSRWNNYCTHVYKSDK